MTETEWMDCSDPKPMLELLEDRRASDRKLRMFAALCCRRAWNQHDPRSIHPAVLASECAAEGIVSHEELKVIEQGIGAMGSYSAAARRLDVARASVNQVSSDAARGASACAVSYFALSAMESIGEETARRKAFALAEQFEKLLQATMLREMFGNPFRAERLNPSWLTAEVTELAQKAFRDPKSHRFLLAEALKRAGCDNSEILAHCNQLGGHLAGCWAIDLLLGKE